MNSFIPLQVLFFSFLFASVASQAQDYSFIQPNSENACQLIPESGIGVYQPQALAVDKETKIQTNFFKLINHVQKVYAPLFKKHDLDVEWAVDWTSPVENAFVRPEGGNKRKILLYGGLYRNKDMTHDGYLFVLCHEIGHLMGGAPQHAYFPEVSAEGQADYYSTNTCLPLVFAGQNNTAHIKKLNVPLQVKLECDSTWKTAEASAICQRSIMAAYSFAKLLSAYGPKVSFNTPSKAKVDQTMNGMYPDSQCRFDTTIAGSLCAKGLKSTQEVGESANCSLHNLLISGSARPQCWFKSPGM